MIFLLIGVACSPSEQQGSRQEDQGAQPTTEEGARAGERTGTDLAGLLNEPTYRTVTDDTKALRVEVPSGWEVLTGEDSEAGNSWSSFRGESVGASITASSDLNAWHNTSKVPGTYIVASRELAQRHTDDELVVLGPNDFSSWCESSVRQNFDRSSYSGRMQAWKDCDGSDEANFLTLAAAPEGRECVVLLQIGMYGEADVESGQHILDTFEADCGLVSSHASEPAPSRTPPEGGGDLGCSDFDARTKAQVALDKDQAGKACEYPPRAPGFNPNPKTGSQEERTPDTIPSSGAATGVLEKPEITSYMYGTHAITDEASGTRYALRSEDGRLLDGYVGRRVTVYGTPVSGYENGLEGGPPLLSVTRVEPA